MQNNNLVYFFTYLVVDNNIHIDCRSLQTFKLTEIRPMLYVDRRCISLLTVIGFAPSRGVKRATVDIHFNVTLIQV